MRLGNYRPPLKWFKPPLEASENIIKLMVKERNEMH